MEILKEEVQAIERAVAGDTLPQKRPMKAPSMAAALLTGGSHPSYSCKEVTSVEERETHPPRVWYRCYVCRSNARCRGRHHSSICKQRDSSPAVVKPKARDSGGGEPPPSTTRAVWNEIQWLHHFGPALWTSGSQADSPWLLSSIQTDRNARRLFELF